MPATVDPRRIIELQDQADPDTGEFPSVARVAELLAAEYGFEVKRGRVHMAARRYRTAHGLPPAPNAMRNGHLPWKIPDEAHRDQNGYALHRVARLAIAAQKGEECALRADEQRHVDAFWRYLKRAGDDMVIAWDAEACRGAGGWLVRQREQGEEVWYGCAAVVARPR